MSELNSLPISPVNGTPLGGEAQSLPTSDPATQPSESEVIAGLALLSPMDYDRARKEKSKLLGIQVKTLDTLVKTARSEVNSNEDRLPFPDVDPYEEPIVPADLLDEIVSTIRTYIVLDIEQAYAIALWVAFTWLIDDVEIAPLLLVNAPEKACGKSQLLDCASRLSYKPLSASNCSTAALFRACELYGPTLFIDEADTFIRENNEIKGLINAGHTRTNAYVIRVTGENHEPKMFRVWGAKAFAGICLEKHLPDSTLSRAIIIHLRRKLAHESVSRLRHAEKDLFTTIASKLARFSEDYSQQVRAARTVLPDALSDRDQDNWSGLLSIAYCAGEEWFKRAIAAALKLSNSGEKSVSVANQLLMDIQQVFASKKVERISTAGLIATLVDDEELPWATYNRGKPLSPSQLAKQLRPYDISSKTVRFGHSNTLKGYDLSQFTDAFARYLAPSELPSQGNDAAEANGGEGSSVTDDSDVTHDQMQLIPKAEMPSALEEDF
ncbi:DUF3631 domain-containing protein [Methylotenera sp.]|uniref:DUF3631 domain-containing protein n=1 Tax=Methylotenera sp. TaxID=2051956 RepID=UPI00248A30D5|nr:DUF3631 domain-containing protein [Methylotenera sp.]MDI1361809.1 DUF3631 domain-containing protein [Methylotenera sp.]